jgi:hypothetical protein
VNSTSSGSWLVEVLVESHFLMAAGTSVAGTPVEGGGACGDAHVRRPQRSAQRSKNASFLRFLTGSPFSTTIRIASSIGMRPPRLPFHTSRTRSAALPVGAQIAKLLLRLSCSRGSGGRLILLAHGHRKHLRLSALVLTFVHAQQPPQEQLDDRTHHGSPAP